MSAPESTVLSPCTETPLRSPLWAIRGGLSSRNYWLLALLGLLLPLAGWWLATAQQWGDKPVSKVSNMVALAAAHKLATLLMPHMSSPPNCSV